MSNPLSLSLSLAEFGCSDDCPYKGKPWPSHMPAPTCRLITESFHIANPVTLASYRGAIRNRINGNKINKPCEPRSKEK